MLDMLPKRRLLRHAKKVFIIGVFVFLVLEAKSWIRLSDYLDSNTVYDTSIDIFGNLINRQTQNNINNKPMGILVVTYPGSGSPILGELLPHGDDIFYVFDPIRQLIKMYVHNKPIRWLNGTISEYGQYDTQFVHKEALVGLLTCDFSRVYASVFDDFRFIEHNRKHRPYFDCVMNTYNNKTKNALNAVNKTKHEFQSESNEHCIREFQQACIRSKKRIVISTQTSLFLSELIYKEINLDLKLKVIHLLSDPRSSVLNTKKLINSPNVAFGSLAQYLCFRIWNDTTTKPHITVPVLTIFYEASVKFTESQIKLIYEFLGLDYSSGAVHRNDNIKNKYQSIDAWKHELSLADIADIQFFCTKTLSYYGYQIYDVIGAAKKVNMSELIKQ